MDYATKALEAADVDTKRIGYDTRMVQAVAYALLDVAAAIREHATR